MKAIIDSSIPPLPQAPIALCLTDVDYLVKMQDRLYPVKDMILMDG